MPESELRLFNVKLVMQNDQVRGIIFKSPWGFAYSCLPTPRIAQTEEEAQKWIEENADSLEKLWEAQGQ